MQVAMRGCCRALTLCEVALELLQLGVAQAAGAVLGLAGGQRLTGHQPLAVRVEALASEAWAGAKQARKRDMAQA